MGGDVIEEDLKLKEGIFAHFNNSAPAEYALVTFLIAINHEQIAESIKILNETPQIKVIYANIFGGILDCDKIAATMK